MYNMKYKIVKENKTKEEQFQEDRINAFSEIENRLEAIKKPLRQAKIETIKYYRENRDRLIAVQKRLRKKSKENC